MSDLRHGQKIKSSYWGEVGLPWSRRLQSPKNMSTTLELRASDWLITLLLTWGTREHREPWSDFPTLVRVLMQGREEHIYGIFIWLTSIIPDPEIVCDDRPVHDLLLHVNDLGEVVDELVGPEDGVLVEVPRGHTHGHFAVVLVGGREGLDPRLVCKKSLL